MSRYISERKVLEDYRPRIKMEWLYIGRSSQKMCPNCGHKTHPTNYCSRCGTEMDRSKKSKEDEQPKAFYAIKKGHQSNVIMKSWAECQPLVYGYSNARYEKFDTLEEAKAWLRE